MHHLDITFLSKVQFVVAPEGTARRGGFWDGVIPLTLELKQMMGSRKLTVVSDAYFSKVPFIRPLLSEGIYVVTRMRKDAVAWDKRTIDKNRKTPKMDGKWTLST